MCEYLDRGGTEESLGVISPYDSQAQSSFSMRCNSNECRSVTKSNCKVEVEMCKISKIYDMYLRFRIDLEC